MVEIQFTVSAVPIKNNRFKMILNLCSLALMDDSFTEVIVLSKSVYHIFDIIFTESKHWSS